MQSKATTVDAYLAELPADRREALQAVRKVILANLDRKGFEEGMSYGMIGYYVPHRVFPAGYHCDPKQGLPYAALASQKNYMSLFLMGLYCGCAVDEDTELVRWFHQAWAKTGKKLDMGKACIRFKKLEDLPLEVIGEAIRRVPAKMYIDVYERSRDAMKTGRPAAKSAARKSATTAPAVKKKVARKAR